MREVLLNTQKYTLDDYNITQIHDAIQTNIMLLLSFE